MARLWRILWLDIGLCWLMAFAYAEVPVPSPSSPVVDQAGFLRPDEQNALAQQLLAFHQQKGSQIAVLIVPTLAPETPFDYGTRVMDSWKLGRQGIDDGVLLLVVANEHKTQLLVGRGLEGAIPDAVAKRILQDTLKPYLKSGKRLEGLQAATQQVQQLINGEALPPAARQASSSSDDNWFVMGFAVLFAGGVLTRLFGRLLGSVLVGSFAFVLALMLGAGIFFALLLSCLAAVFSVLFSFGRSVGMSWPGGGWGGGSSGGGWSGGGGGFGGGGASGDW